MKRKDNKYKNRLLKLADFLDKLPKNRFDYCTWVGDDWEGKKDLSCGTTACALGWATTIPAFRKLGLRMIRYNSGAGGVCLKKQEHNIIDSYDDFVYSLAAGKKIFGLDDIEFEYIFVPADYNFDKKPGNNATPKQVAKHIRKFVKEKYG